MKRPIFIAAALAFCLLSTASNAASAGYGFTLCLTTGKAVYSQGETAGMTLRVANFSADAVTLRFSDARRYDFAISRDGKVLWRWSDGRVFAQVLGAETLNPGDTLSYTAKVVLKLRPGLYMVTGTVTAAEPLSASTRIRIK
jgi:hypothetical protein